MGADADGIFISGSYFTSIDSPANKEFLAAMQKKFGAELQDAERSLGAAVRGVYLYKAAVEKAGSTGRGQGASRPCPRCRSTDRAARSR